MRKETKKPKTQQQFNIADNWLASRRTNIIQRNCPIKLKSIVKCTQKKWQPSISSSVVMRDERECFIHVDNKSLMIILLFWGVILLKVYGDLWGLILSRSAKACTVERQILSSNQYGPKDAKRKGRRNLKNFGENKAGSAVFMHPQGG